MIAYEGKINDTKIKVEINNIENQSPTITINATMSLREFLSIAAHIVIAANEEIE